MLKMSYCVTLFMALHQRDKRSFYIYVYYTIDGIDLVF